MLEDDLFPHFPNMGLRAILKTLVPPQVKTNSAVPTRPRKADVLRVAPNVARLWNLHFDAIWANTIAEVEPRYLRKSNQGTHVYYLNRGEYVKETKTAEYKIERPLHNKSIKDPNLQILPDFCQQLLSYAVPLYAGSKGSGLGRWGAIDLVGKSACGIPVIIELKAGTKDVPIQLLMQAVSYAIAFRRQWADSDVLRKEWAERNDTALPSPELPELRVLCVAPPTYWSHYQADIQSQRESFKSLLTNLAQEDRRTIVEFASIDIATLSLSRVTALDP